MQDLADNASLVKDAILMKDASSVEDASLVNGAIIIEDARLAENSSLVNDASLIKDASIVEVASIVEDAIILAPTTQARHFRDGQKLQMWELSPDVRHLQTTQISKTLRSIHLAPQIQPKQATPVLRVL